MDKKHQGQGRPTGSTDGSSRNDKARGQRLAGDYRRRILGSNGQREMFLLSVLFYAAIQSFIYSSYGLIKLIHTCAWHIEGLPLVHRYMFLQKNSAPD